jgi:hexosaminidase
MNCNKSLLFCLLLITAISCKQEKTDLTKEVLLPKPVSVNATGEAFELTDGSTIYVEGETEELQKIGRYLADKLNPSTGYQLKVSTTSATLKQGDIHLGIGAEDKELGEEGYEIVITKETLKITANKPAGLFRAVQTIRQLLPAKAASSSKQEGPWKIATGTIRDYPGYAFRGSMLDLGRHFFGVEDIKRYIDLIAFYKMNVLHLHLADDQGWRIEIKSWPNLTTIGGSTQVGGGKGGFLTQDQYKDIVKYAQERYITIIPEIDMPGHTNAALASYPELNCDGKARKLYTGIEVGFSTLCPTKEITYKFIDDVVRELAELTPGPYIHLGGDESHATKKEDYIPFVSKVQEIVKAHGKQMIGWEETAQADMNKPKNRPEQSVKADNSVLQPSATKSNSIAQYWTNPNYAKEAVAKGAMVIMSPATKTYLDMKYDSTTKLGQDWAARIEIDSAYMWDPATRVKGIPRENILGLEAPLWTETITTMDEIEYMVFPRIIGIAEIGWTPANLRSWDDYKTRLGKHGPVMKALEIDFYKSKQVPWVE